MSESKSPERATADTIRTAVMKGEFKMAPDVLTSQLDDEIQEVFIALYLTHKGKEPKRALWVADGQPLGVVLDWDPEAKKYTDKSLVSLKKVSDLLKIPLAPDTLWEDAALALRDKQRTEPVSLGS